MRGADLTMMRDLSLDSSSFPIALCGTCARDVLVYIALDEAERERRCCVHCDSEVADAEIRWVTAAELETEGYYIGAPSVRKAGGGCGGGCGTCGTHAHKGGVPGSAAH
jgi:hypothetical protein